MQAFELSTRLKSFNRKDGASATAKAAYRAGCEIACEREQKTHDYARRFGVERAEIVLPAGAPAWAKDRAKLWNAAELVERNGKRGPRGGQWKSNVVVAREWFFSLPHELSKEGRASVAQAVARHLAEKYGVAVDYAIHTPGEDGDERNWHVHMLMTSRRMTDAGLGGKVTELRDDLAEASAQTKALRKHTAGIINAALKGEGKPARVEWRSFKERGETRTPTRHQGPARTNSQRKRQRIEREAWAQAESAAQAEKHAKETASLKLRHDFERERGKAERLRRYRAFVAQLKAELRAARVDDRPATGLKRAFLKALGALDRAEAERAERSAERTRQAMERAAGMRRALTMDARTQERTRQMQQAELKDRQEAENRQLRQAVAYRRTHDRQRERQARETPRTHDRQREQGQGRERGMDFG